MYRQRYINRTYRVPVRLARRRMGVVWRAVASPEMGLK
jgi:hypothetical protein